MQKRLLSRGRKIRGNTSNSGEESDGLDGVRRGIRRWRWSPARKQTAEMGSGDKSSERDGVQRWNLTEEVKAKQVRVGALGEIG